MNIEFLKPDRILFGISYQIGTVIERDYETNEILSEEVKNIFSLGFLFLTINIII